MSEEENTSEISPRELDPSILGVLEEAKGLMGNALIMQAAENAKESTARMAIRTALSSAPGSNALSTAMYGVDINELEPDLRSEVANKQALMAMEMEQVMDELDGMEEPGFFQKMWESLGEDIGSAIHHQATGELHPDEVDKIVGKMAEDKGLAEPGKGKEQFGREAAKNNPEIKAVRDEIQGEIQDTLKNGNAEQLGALQETIKEALGKQSIDMDLVAGTFDKETKNMGKSQGVSENAKESEVSKNLDRHGIGKDAGPQNFGEFGKAGKGKEAKEKDTGSSLGDKVGAAAGIASVGIAGGAEALATGEISEATEQRVEEAIENATEAGIIPEIEEPPMQEIDNQAVNPFADLGIEIEDADIGGLEAGPKATPVEAQEQARTAKREQDDALPPLGGSKGGGKPGGGMGGPFGGPTSAA